jgi:peptidoglycan/LPS O-acetylase OafA/YrhL
MSLNANLDVLKILHGSYNTLVMFLFFYQGFIGWKIRRERIQGKTRDFSLIRKHRKAGPIFAILGVLGFLIGLVLVFIDKGHLLQYPIHFTFGLLLVFLIGLVYFISRKIKGPESPIRTPHFIMGLSLLVIYILQVFIGLDVLF